ncbi:TetR/AcrR family transcriptional regulator [Streptomyces sp. H39-S7]|uniref:TetR/AcrR family transcriptional regulator n=1 Tax=Streptomyces sp. H39-S7 TaxID=3004357 RepID=UPI0022AE7E90|nr:TetR/AcrR family transcriptional regulator C-terminal domain-containing protein [Streptomyces sp. H39-S7]MCZ4122804.1 TetR/AcrR family transcriptional regulator C-terminal domain-containing protein [Streptomyces sp. H39-S7]
MTEPSAHSIWLRPERAGRGPTPTFDRDRIAAAGIALGDADGLPAVTMRAVAVALGAGPASLYRYVATRDELLELMIDQVNGEISYAALGSGHWLDDLLALARQSRSVYLAHPWLLDATATRTPVGPHAVTYLEHALAALADLDVSPRTKLEAIAILNAVVSTLTRAEVIQRLAGQTIPQWQQAQTEYLTQVAMAGHHPHLATALTGQPPEAEDSPESLLVRILIRVLTGLLQPDAIGATSVRGRAEAEPPAASPGSTAAS